MYLVHHSKHLNYQSLPLKKHYKKIILIFLGSKCFGELIFHNFYALIFLIANYLTFKELPIVIYLSLENFSSKIMLSIQFKFLANVSLNFCKGLVFITTLCLR